MATEVKATTPVELRGSSGGRVSGKGWKHSKSATRRSHLPAGVKARTWEERMEKEKKEGAIKKLEQELKEEKNAEFTRRKDVTAQRKKAALERQQFEEMKAKMSAKKAARLKRKAGRSKKVNG
ncbi:hypothetical protein JB92DRAFT_2910904 [Gautieria morchelliformis]|nr:hypothetical protein JB92DRAFT_2910904 [Gautieria morchelliformis]